MRWTPSMERRWALDVEVGFSEVSMAYDPVSGWVAWPAADCWRGLVSRSAYQRVWLWALPQVPASAIFSWKVPYWERGLRISEMTREQLENQFPVDIVVDTATGDVLMEVYHGALGRGFV